MKMPTARDVVAMIFCMCCFQDEFLSVVTPRNFEFDSLDKGRPSIQFVFVKSIPACVLSKCMNLEITYCS